MKVSNRVTNEKRSLQVVKIAFTLSLTLAFSTGCWLSRDWDDCLNDRDCPTGQICWLNDRTRVCIPPEYVDLGAPDVVDDSTDFGAEDVVDVAEDPADLADDSIVDSSEDSALAQPDDQPPDSESDVDVDGSDDPLADLPNEDVQDEPDASPPPTLTLRGAGITTSSGSILSAGRYRLVNHGIEQHERVCSGHFCVTGGITP